MWNPLNWPNPVEVIGESIISGIDATTNALGFGEQPAPVTPVTPVEPVVPVTPVEPVDPTTATTIADRLADGYNYVQELSGLDQTNVDEYVAGGLLAAAAGYLAYATGRKLFSKADKVADVASKKVEKAIDNLDKIADVIAEEIAEAVVKFIEEISFEKLISVGRARQVGDRKVLLQKNGVTAENFDAFRQQFVNDMVAKGKPGNERLNAYTGPRAANLEDRLMADMAIFAKQGFKIEAEEKKTSKPSQ